MSDLSWAHSTSSPAYTIRRIPSYVSFILQYLSAEISKKRHYQCGTRITTADCSPRVDAQASADRTGIGGWFPTRDLDGNLDPWLSQWFSLEVTFEEVPWIFEKGQRSSLVISTLEALAMLVALKLKFGEMPDPDDTRVLIVQSITDNRGNGALLNKLTSKRFPSSASLMEMASYMKSRGPRAIVEWAPREFNREADSLAKGDTTAFDAEKRLHVNKDTLKCNTLPQALEAGRERGTRASQDKREARIADSLHETTQEESRDEAEND